MDVEDMFEIHLVITTEIIIFKFLKYRVYCLLIRMCDNILYFKPEVSVRISGFPFFSISR